MEFEETLKAFELAMRTTFAARHMKQRNSGNQNVLDAGFDGTMLSESRILRHLMEEYNKLCEAIDIDNLKEACTNLANMAFLLWWNLMDTISYWDDSKAGGLGGKKAP